MEIIKSKTNFPNDRDYTLNAILEELALLERHCRDGSFKICRCIPEKHLPTLSGLSSEGYGFAETEDEKEFMDKLMNIARLTKQYIEENGLNDKDADKLRAFARELRHSVEFRDWKADMSGTPEVDNNKGNCLACDLIEAKSELIKKENEVIDMERPMRDEEERRKRHMELFGELPPERQFRNRMPVDDDALPTLPFEFGLLPPMPRALAKKLINNNNNK